MLRHMRTTIDLPDPLFKQAKQLAERRGLTLRRFVEDALRRYIGEEKKRPPFKLQDASFRGDGLRSGLDWSDWERIRDLAYEGHGG